MDYFDKIRVQSVIILSSFAIFVAVGRCSPITPSALKSTLRNGSPTQADPAKSTSPTQVVLINFSTQIMSSEKFAPIGRQPHKVTLSESELSTQLDEFVKTGSTQIPIEGSITDEGVAYIEVSNLTPEIARNSSQYRLTLSKASEKAFALSVASSVPPALAKEVQSNITTIAIDFQGSRQIPIQSISVIQQETE